MSGYQIQLSQASGKLSANHRTKAMPKSSWDHSALPFTTLVVSPILVVFSAGDRAELLACELAYEPACRPADASACNPSVEVVVEVAEPSACRGEPPAPKSWASRELSS